MSNNTKTIFKLSKNEFKAIILFGVILMTVPLSFNLF